VSTQAEAESAAPEEAAPDTHDTHSTQQEEDPAPADRARSFSDIWLPFWNVLRS